MGYQEQFAGGTSATAGASPEAIRFHYDIGTDFFRTWLGDELIYSAARWCDPLAGSPRALSLEEAQNAKLDFHLGAVRTGPGRALLDIGCGWGALMRRAVCNYGVSEVTGVTLSGEQFEYIEAKKPPRTNLLLESYETLTVKRPVDAIVSIGAFEHFAKPALPREAKIAIYGSFFSRCHAFLKPGARLSLQTIFWQNVERAHAHAIVPNAVFPESDLPFLDEVFEAAQSSFRTLYFEASEDDYVSTLREWLRRLRQARAESPHLVDDAKFLFHQDYLRRCIVGFARHRISLARIVFERV